MSIESMAKALNRTDVAGATKLVLIGIANHDGDGGAWPTIATLARYGSCTERRVQQCIASLVEMGLIEVAANAGGTTGWRNDRRPNRYLLHLDGVNSTSSRSDGVKSEAARGEISDTHGGKPTSPKPSMNHPQPSNSLSPAEASDLFEQWWKLYRCACDLTGSSAGSKGDALKEWMKLKLAEKAVAVDGIGRHYDVIYVSPGRYVMPNGRTWLSKKRWLDDTPQEPPRKQNSSQAMDRVREIVGGNLTNRADAERNGWRS